MKRIMKTWISICVIFLTITTAVSKTTQRPKKPSKIPPMRYITNWDKYKLPKEIHVKDLTKILEYVAYYKQMKYCPFENKIKCRISDLKTIIAKIVSNYFSIKSMNETQRNETSKVTSKKNDKMSTKKIKKEQIDKLVTDSKHDGIKESAKIAQRIGYGYDYHKEPFLNNNVGQKRILKLELISMLSYKQWYHDKHKPSFQDFTRELDCKGIRKMKHSRFQRDTATTPVGWCGGRRRWIRKHTTKTTKLVKPTTITLSTSKE